MIPYREWAPTGFDTPGLGARLGNMQDVADWLVLGTCQTRDSEPLDCSNFESAQKILDDAGAVYEVHRFGHWGCGWIEIIIVHPRDVAIAQELENQLADYPVLDEDDLGERELEAFDESWRAYGARDFAYTVAKHHGLSDTLADWLWDTATDDDWRDLWTEHDHHSTYDHLDTDGTASRVTRPELATLLRACRRRTAGHRQARYDRDRQYAHEALVNSAHSHLRGASLFLDMGNGRSWLDCYRYAFRLINEANATNR